MPQDQPGKGLGHFLDAMRIDAFRTAEAFKKDMDNWIRRFKESVPVTGENRVVIPGEPEVEYENERLENGIPLLATVVDDLMATGSKFNVHLAT